MAAIGELVFYITAQEEEIPVGTVGQGVGGVSDSRWVLPQGAVAVLTKCLKDDSDEAVCLEARPADQASVDVGL